MSELASCLKAQSSDRVIVREVSCKFQSVSAGHKENIVRNISLQPSMRYKHRMYGSKHKSANNNSPWKMRILNLHYSLLLNYNFSIDSCFSLLGRNFCHDSWRQWLFFLFFLSFFFLKKKKANIMLLQVVNTRNHFDNHMLSSQIRTIITDIRITLYIHVNYI